MDNNAIQHELQRYGVADSAIAAMRSEYMPLIIADINDTAGFNAVHSARMVVKNHRVQVEKVRKELKADSLDYGRRVDAEAKRICALLEPIESHLTTEEDAFEAAKEAIRNAARLKAEVEAKALADAEAARVKAEHDAEVERMRIERDKLDAERKAMEAARAIEAAKLKEAQDKIDAERRTVEAEKKRLAEIEAARLREIETQRRESEAAERAKIETEQRIAREAAAEKAKAEAEEAARLKAEALRPDREKLLAVADGIKTIRVPTVSLDAMEAWNEICVVLRDAEERIRVIAENLK